MCPTIGPGCTYPLQVTFAIGPDFTEPVAQFPESYRTQVMPVAGDTELKWWELFKDPLLYSLVTTALENNRDLKVAISRIDQARATV